MTARQRARIEQTRVRQQIAELEARLAELPVGVASVSVDGTSTAFARRDVLDELDRLRKRLAVLAGARERISTIRLDSAF